MHSTLFDVLLASGGVAAEYHGRSVVRHFSDPAAEYRAATETTAVFDRSHRGRLMVTGQAPGRMLEGLLTGHIPDLPDSVVTGVLDGIGTYHGVLTSKGKMITDLWALLLGPEDEAGFLLDVPATGVAGLTENLQKFLPPRFATTKDASSTLGMLSVVGPSADEVLSRTISSDHLKPENLAVLPEGAWRAVGAGLNEGFLIMRTEDVWPNAYSVFGRSRVLRELWQALVDNGVVPAGQGVWSTLRVEAERPLFGVDMNENTIPIEAGIHTRSIDYEKGCFTGQEVIIRIRDRGHVNRNLKSLRLGNIPTPSSGTELYDENSEKVVGFITSAVQSPKFDEVIGLAYVRRGYEVVMLNGQGVTVPQE